MKNRLTSVICGITLLTGTAGAQAATVYISDNYRSLYSVETSTWQAVKIGSTPQVMTDIAFSPSGELYGVTASALWSVNLQTPSTSTRVGTSIIPPYVNALTFSPDGTLYAANTYQRLFAIDETDGTYTQLTGFLPKASSGDLEFDSAGNLYLSGYGGVNSGDQLIRVNQTASAVSGTFIGWFGVTDMLGLAYTDNTMYGFSNQDAYRIDLTTGNAEFISSISGMDNNTIIYGASASPVPIPGAAWLLGTGLLALLGIRKKALDPQ